MKKKFKKGFSLVELLVVIAIIGILAAVGITAYSGYTKNAKAKAAMSQFSQVEAIVNAELARCAVGEGNMIWGTAGTDLVPEVTDMQVATAAMDPDAEILMAAGEMAAVPYQADICGTFPPDHTNIVGYINGGGIGIIDSLGMTNPYNATQVFAVAGSYGVQAQVLGQITVFCGSGGGKELCEIEVMDKATSHNKIQIFEY